MAIAPRRKMIVALTTIISLTPALSRLRARGTMMSLMRHCI